MGSRLHAETGCRKVYAGLIICQCRKEDLTEKAQDIEVTIPVKKSQEARYNLDPESFFVSRFWGRRPDGVTNNEALKIGYILEFKRSTHRDEGFLQVKDAKANEQH